jgi:hypothetical protein
MEENKGKPVKMDEGKCHLGGNGTARKKRKEWVMYSMGSAAKYIILPRAQAKAFALTKLQPCPQDRAPNVISQSESLLYTISSLDKIGAVSLY